MLHRSLNRNYPVAVEGEGAWLITNDGQRQLDFAASAVVNFIGHGDASVARAIAEQARALEFVHSSQFTTEVAERFAQQLLEFAGESFQGGAVFFTSGGSESVETALKLARQYHVERGESDRYQVVSRFQSYHGATLGALAVSGNQSRRAIYLPMIREFPKAHIPYCYRCRYNCAGKTCDDCGRQYAAEVEQAIAETGGTAAAFILEPVSGATLGAAVPNPGYLPEVAEICRRSGILLIADEVMTGVGRTGRNFAVDHWNVDGSATPDLITVGKGISSGYAPLGAVIARAHVVDAIANGSGSLLHGFTYNGHPLAVAAGRAVLQRITLEHLVERANSDREGSIACTLKHELQKLWNIPCVGDIRGLGLLWSIEFVADRATKQPFEPQRRFSAAVYQEATQRGVLVYPMQGCADGTSGDHIMIAPPAIIQEQEVGWAVERLGEAIEAARAQLKSSGIQGRVDLRDRAGC